jgi:hypothetical protein
MEGERPIWDMPKVRRWVNDGLKPDSPDVIDGYGLKAMENDDMIRLESTIGGQLVVTLTGLGNHEADRLEVVQAMERQAAEAATEGEGE